VLKRLKTPLPMTFLYLKRKMSALDRDLPLFDERKQSAKMLPLVFLVNPTDLHPNPS